MDFIAFARAHGIIIDHLPPIGVWRRYPTEDKMGKRNGAIKYLGTHAFLQNWAVSTEVEVWKAEGTSEVDMNRYRRDMQEAERKRKQQQVDAAKKARWILDQCQYGFHPYLAAKGFPDTQANIWKTDDGLVLVIPMHIGRQLVGCQLIREDGSKKFLFGQVTSAAEHIIGDSNGKVDVLVEGFATALSVKKVMSKINPKCRIHVCFSAHNLVKIAAKIGKTSIVICDNDASGTGERVAKQIGWPYFIPPDVGCDFNDHHMKYKQAKAEFDLRKCLFKLQSEGIIKPFR